MLLYCGGVVEWLELGCGVLLIVELFIVRTHFSLWPFGVVFLTNYGKLYEQIFVSFFFVLLV